MDETKTPDNHPYDDDYCLADDGSSADASTLFIGDLAKSVSETELEGLFARYGPVQHVEIKRDKITLNNLGYGFVQFHQRRDASLAKKELDGYVLNGRKIRTGWAQKNTSLFVFNIPEGLTDDTLRHIFSKYGEVSAERTTVRHGLYGFVRFHRRVSAEQARAALDGKLLTATGEILEDSTVEGKPCRITWGDSNTQHNCVHFRFEPRMHDEEVVITEQEIADHFSSCGQVQRITLPRHPNGSAKGYAFVHFPDNTDGEKSAVLAINSLHNSLLGGNVKIQCNFGKKQQPVRENFKRHRFEHNYNPAPQAFYSGIPPMYSSDGSPVYSQAAMDFFPYPTYYPPLAPWMQHLPPMQIQHEQLVENGSSSPTSEPLIPNHIVPQSYHYAYPVYASRPPQELSAELQPDH